MKNVGFILVLSFCVTLNSCYQDPLLKNLDEESIVFSRNSNFHLGGLFVQTDGGKVGGMNATYLTEEAWGMAITSAQAIANQCPMLCDIAKSIYDKGIRIRLAIDHELHNTTNLSLMNKDAYYNSSVNIIFFSDVADVFSERIVFHEMLHVFQNHWAGIELTPDNEAHTEFEVWLVYDIIQCMFRGELPKHLEGGDSLDYRGFVYSCSRGGASDLTLEEISEKFEQLYKLYPSSIKEPAYIPWFLFYFLKNI